MNSDWKVALKQGKSILLFDGVCNLCHGAVRFVLPRDKHQRIVFASLQSGVGEEVMQQMGLPPDQLKTIVLVDGKDVLLRSDAALRICWYLGGLWSWLYALRIVPVWLRNPVYDWVASNRYRWFGKKDACPMPRPEWRDRFLDGHA